MYISGTTTLFGLIGSPVEHSKSPDMYNHCFQTFGLDWAYLAFNIPLEKTGEAVQTIRTLHMRGDNVTMPCKSAVIPCLDKRTIAARAIHAVNTIANEDGVLMGHNTDGCGYTAFPVAGPLSDRLGRRLSVLIGCALYAIFLLTVTFSTNIYLGYVLAVISGMANSFLDTSITPSCMEILRRRAPSPTFSWISYPSRTLSVP